MLGRIKDFVSMEISTQTDISPKVLFVFVLFLFPGIAQRPFWCKSLIFRPPKKKKETLINSTKFDQQNVIFLLFNCVL